MMTEHNGLMLFPVDEDFSDHPVFSDLKSVSLGAVRFPHGFFVKQEDNGGKYVIPATPEERASILLNAFPDMTSEEALSAGCGPYSSGRCLGGCSGFPFRCVQVFHPTSGFYSCFCRNMG
jgi:hypothetical protein